MVRDGNLAGFTSPVYSTSARAHDGEASLCEITATYGETIQSNAKMANLKVNITAAVTDHFKQD